MSEDVTNFATCLWALRGLIAFVVVVTAVCLLYVETKES